MTGSADHLHEDPNDLDELTIDRHRAIRSIMEELEAVDWYDQRAAATRDETLAAVLAHNRDEEKEHAAMTLEWLRRNDSAFDGHLRTYLFSADDITGIEQEDTTGASGGSGGSGSRAAGLGIGSLQGEEQR